MVRIVVAVLIALVAATVAAEHTVYYRYVVLGFVKDAQGKLRPGREVEVVRNKTGLVYSARTDEQGLFVIIVRLGDESAGETLTLRVGRATTTTWSPVLKKLIALATVSAPHFAGGTALEIEVTVEAVRNRVPATVVKTPFFNPPRKTAAPIT